MNSYVLLRWYFHLSEQRLSEGRYITITQPFCFLIGKVMMRYVHVVICSNGQHSANILDPFSLHLNKRQLRFLFDWD